jgi:hypothetical protein
MKNIHQLPGYSESLQRMKNETFVVMTPEVFAGGEVKMTDNILFKTASDFSQFVETEANKQDMSCTDVILAYCDSKDIDPDAIAKLVNSSLKGKLENEMIQSGLMSAHNTLDNF